MICGQGGPTQNASSDYPQAMMLAGQGSGCPSAPRSEPAVTRRTAKTLFFSDILPASLLGVLPRPLPGFPPANPQRTKPGWHSGRRSTPSHRGLLQRLAIGVLALGLALVVQWPTHAEEIGFRISWGGGSPTRWTGRISVTNGEILRWNPIGSEVDEHGSLVFANGKIDVLPSTPRTFQGMDFVIEHSPDTSLEVELSAVGSPPQSWTLPVDEMKDRLREISLDKEGNVLFVERLAGDELHVEPQRPHLVFETGETWKFELQPRALPYPEGTRIEVQAQIVESRNSPREGRYPLLNSLTSRGRTQESPWAAVRYETAVDKNLGVPLELKMPDVEGCFDVLITAEPIPASRLPESLVRSFGRPGPVLQRRVQVVVLDPKRKNPPSETEQLTLLGEAVAASNASFRERLARITPQLPRLGNLGQGWRILHSSDQQVMNELAAAKPGEDPAWAVYSLPVQEIGRPHVLEVEYPADRRQSLLFAVLEANSVGAIAPPIVDFGTYSSGESERWGEPQGWRVYRTIFWPRSKEPLLLVANTGGDAAVYGRIKVYAGWQHLPQLFPPSAFPNERLVAAYFHRPMLAASFGATDVPGPFRYQGLDDWVTFYQATTRLAESLAFSGYNAVVLSVAADGSTLYPSTRWQPTPRFDSGRFSPDGADPVRKDVLELTLRVADREGFFVIPALDFSTPLPRLETAIREGGEKAQGLRWIGLDGRPLTESQPPYRGMAPYYNILHRQVQEEILAIVREIVERYGQHPAFFGLGIQVSNYGYVQLPGPQWGMDDETVARFCEETGIVLSVPPEQRFAERARLLLGLHYRDWVQWRTASLQSFFARMHQELAAVRPDTKLLVLTPTMFVGERWEQKLRPSLIDRRDPLALFQEVGLTPEIFSAEPGVAFFRVKRIVDHADLTLRTSEFEIEQLYRAWSLGAPAAVPGLLFYHPPQELRIPTFEAHSPIQPANTTMIHQPIPFGWENRRRFAQGLGEMDTPLICDGGWRLPWGEEANLRGWLAGFRRLPAGTFQDVRFQDSNRTLQPLVMRRMIRAQETYVYIVNQASFPVTLNLTLEIPQGARMIELSWLRALPPLQADAPGRCQWQVTFEPYEFLAFKISSPLVTFIAGSVSWSPKVKEQLRQQIADLSERVATLSSPPLYEALQNPDFEAAPTPSEPIPGWQIMAPAETLAHLDTTQKHSGNQSLHLSSSGPQVAVTCHAFPPPPTGRLTIAMWLRVPNPSVQPTLRCVIIGACGGQSLVRIAEVGASTTGRPVPQIAAEWTPILVEVPDLPLIGLSPLQLRFELTGPGELWIDDLQLCHLAFSKTERVELFKLIAPAQSKLENGEIAECLRLLNGYWPQYLVEFVPRAEITMSAPARPKAAPVATDSGQPVDKAPDRSAGVLDRVRQIWPQRLRF